jgi:hypothetical protein
VVQTWTPGEGFHDNPSGIVVSLLLSHESDRISTEQAFSLTEDHRAVKGDFSWEASRLTFIPYAPLEADREYRISLGTGAQDTKGLSLENKFEAFFTTRVSGGKPKIIRAEPEFEGKLSGNRGEFRLFFSEPVRLSSCMDYVSFVPSTPGSWRLEDENKTVCFIPREPWQTGNLYRIKVESGFTFASGAVLGTEYSSVFGVGEDMEKPVLLKALALLPDGEDEEISLEQPGVYRYAEYSSWESSTRLRLVFSEPVDLHSVRNLLTSDPTQALVMESPPEMAYSVVFRFNEYPLWGSSFLFRLGPGVRNLAGNESKDEYFFRIKAAGPLSKPPSLVGIRLPMSPGSNDDLRALSYSLMDSFNDLPIKIGEGRYPYNERIPSWIELYFETAPDTGLDLFSLMDLFRVEATNQALTFLPRNIRTKDFNLNEASAGWESFTRVQIDGILVNSVHTGIVSFRIPPGLKDQRGNKSAVDFRISLLK